MSAINGRCECGKVTMTDRDVMLLHCQDDDQWSYVFVCPECGARVAKDCSRHTADVLLTYGVRMREWTMPLELHERGVSYAPAFTLDDLLDFHELLERTHTIHDWVQHIKDARR